MKVWVYKNFTISASGLSAYGQAKLIMETVDKLKGKDHLKFELKDSAVQFSYVEQEEI